MLERKIFAVALPIIAGATIVGSGFAAWVFGDQGYALEGKDFGVHLTEEATIKGLKLEYKFTGSKIGDHNGDDATTAIAVQESDKIELVLDQGKETSTDGTTSTKNVETGIHFKLTRGNNSYLLKTLELSIIEETEGRLQGMYDAGFKVELETSIAFDEHLLNLVAVKTETTWNDFGLSEATKTVTQDVTADKQIGGKTSITFTFESDPESGTEHTFYSNNKMFKYHATTVDTKIAKPTTSAEYATFKTEFDKVAKDKAISITNRILVADPSTK